MNYSTITTAALVSAAWASVLAEILVARNIRERQRYREEQRQRQARIALNVEVVDPGKAAQPVFGMDEIVDGIPDLIDRVLNPADYAGLRSGNEILIVGPRQSGKKSLALHIARSGNIDQVVIVHNPSDADVLIHAKTLLEKDRHLSFAGYARKLLSRKNHAGRTLLLLPGLDQASGHTGEPWLDQLQALIETSETRPDILVVGTAQHYDRESEVASWFGTVLPLPGGQDAERPDISARSDQWKSMMQKVAEGYLDTILKTGYRLAGLKGQDFTGRILSVAINSAEVEDIVMHCQTMAIYNRKQKPGEGLQITHTMLDRAIGRVVPDGSWTGLAANAVAASKTAPTA